MIDYKDFVACEECGWKKHPKEDCWLCALNKRIGKKTTTIYHGDVREFNKYEHK